MEYKDFQRVNKLEPLVRDIWVSCGGAPEFLSNYHIIAINEFLANHDISVFYSISKALEGIPWRTDDRYFCILMAMMLEYSVVGKCEGYKI